MPIDLQAPGRYLAALAGTILVILGPPAAAAEPTWTPAGERRGVALEQGQTAAGVKAYRGAVTVCTSLRGLQAFVADASRLSEWIPYTEEARPLPSEADSPRYYVRTSAPWPLKPRDMVYQLLPRPVSEDGVVRIDVQGLPDALPALEGASRMRSAEGQWRLEPVDHRRIHVRLRLAADPGRVPAFFANRRLASTLGGMLANLAEEFPCDDG